MSEPTGADLARQMLNIARAEARKRGTTPARPKRRVRMPLNNGRDPVGVGNVIDQLAEAYGWRKPSAGAQVIIRWAELVPDLARLAEPERYDADTQTLHLRPVSAAAGTQLRLTASRIPTQLNERTGAETVRAVRILSPGGTAGRPAETPAAVHPAASEPTPVRTRETASAGYRQALAAHQEKKTAHDDNLAPAVRAAIEAQDQALREHREDPDAFADARELVEDLRARAQAAADPRRQAIARARAERAGHALDVPRVLDQTG